MTEDAHGSTAASGGCILLILLLLAVVIGLGLAVLVTWLTMPKA